MLINETKDKMSRMKLRGMLEALEEQLLNKDLQSLDFEERLGFLIEKEFLQRENQRLASRLKQARLGQAAILENFDFKKNRGITKSQILSFGQCDWIREKKNIIITGATGTGKTFLANALAQKACREGFTAQYFRLGRLFDELLAATGDGTYIKVLEKIAKKNLLVIDDWGLNSLDDKQRKDFFEIVEDRFDKQSLIIVSQIPVDKWYELIGDSTLADAILDRVLHASYKIQLKGASMRKNLKGVEHDLP